MFKWYEGANVCYAYLEDVSIEDGKASWKAISQSRWFTRGWTLQELLAPEFILFFGKNWTILGEKSQRDEHKEFVNLISAITGIDEYSLWTASRVRETSISRRMSWAADRETTRPEDRAYSLMGLVHMPILYGEGLENAFERLQLAIIGKSSDQSIFAWTLNEVPPADYACGLLAPSPSLF
jgi:hypothetical protein